MTTFCCGTVVQGQPLSCGIKTEASIICSVLNSSCFAWHPYEKQELFKTEQVIVDHLNFLTSSNHQPHFAFEPCHTETCLKVAYMSYTGLHIKPGVHQFRYFLPQCVPLSITRKIEYVISLNGMFHKMSIFNQEFRTISGNLFQHEAAQLLIACSNEVCDERR